MTFELLPTRATFTAAHSVEVEVRGLPAPGLARVLQWGEPRMSVPITDNGVVDFGRLPVGGYGVQLDAAGFTARTAVEVVAAGTDRMRYGFVADYQPHRDLAGVVDNLRRLHLTDVQFYDWAFRHADLLAGGETYEDALGRPISVATVRDLILAVHQIGARALGYAAVYGVGTDQWPLWSHAALVTPSGETYRLGDFLRLVDPAEQRWLEHFTADLAGAAEHIGFDGFHLDQYGYPKHANRPDGTQVNLEEAFVTVIETVRSALPPSRLVFNNVNDFPTWRTGPSSQDAVYIEVWPPHVTLGHLAALVERARVVGGGKPVVIAAYQHIYDNGAASVADLSTAFTMATLFSHGATHLLCGEADRILVDPYYVRNHRAAESTADLLHRWYDFLVEHVELLFRGDVADVTGALAGPYNDDCDVSYQDVALTETPVAGAVWRRIVQVGGRLVIHLINLVGQDDTQWDTARNAVGALPAGTLRIRRSGPGLPRVRYADPDRPSALRDVAVVASGDHAIARLPSPHVWQIVLIDL